MWISKQRYLELVGRESGEIILELRRQVIRLEEQLKYSLDRADREQLRADSALDRIAVTKGLEPISPAAAPSSADGDPHVEDAVLVEEIRQSIKNVGPLETLMSYK